MKILIRKLADLLDFGYMDDVVWIHGKPYSFVERNREEVMEAV